MLAIGALGVALPVSVRTTAPTAFVTVSFQAWDASTPECTPTVWPDPMRIVVGLIAGATRPAPMSDFTAVRNAGSSAYAALPGHVVVSASRWPDTTLNVTVEPAGYLDPENDPASIVVVLVGSR